MKKITFRKKLGTLILLGSIIPIVVISFISYKIASDALKEAILRGNMIYLEKSAIHIDEYFEGIENKTKAVALFEDFKQVVLDSDDETLKKSKKLLVDTEANLGFTSGFIADATGKVVISDNDELIGLDLSSRDYVSKAMNGSDNWSDLFYSEAKGTNVMVYAVPLKNVDETVGVICFMISQEDINNLIHSGVSELGTSGNSYLVDVNHLLYSETIIGDSVENAALKENVDTYGTQLLSNAINANDRAYTDVSIYNDYTDTTVMGALGTVEVGEKLLGLLIEVDISEGMASVNGMAVKIALIALFIFIFVTILVILIMRSTIKPINRIIGLLKDIAEGDGDLTKRLPVETDDEFGMMSNLFNQFVEKLSTMISDITVRINTMVESSEQITQAVEETNQSIDLINQNTFNVSDGITSNASAIEEINSSIQEIANTTMNISERSSNVSDNSNEMYAAAQNGVKRLEQVKDNIYTLRDMSDNMEAVIDKLNMSSDQISNIVSVITGIADQVNLLALNAAIEAARAGEHGKGFAVVADEVRKLAEESRRSANDITVLIEGIISETSQAKETIQIEQNQVKDSVKNINETDAEMHQIVSRIKAVVSDIDHITEMLSGQTTASEGISLAIEDVAQSSQSGAESVNEITQNLQSQAAVFEEVTASIEDLNAMAEMIKSEIGKFKVDVAIELNSSLNEPHSFSISKRYLANNEA